MHPKSPQHNLRTVNDRIAAVSQAKGQERAMMVFGWAPVRVQPIGERPAPRGLRSRKGA